ncbi:Uncharacterized protein Fot_04405 [Forsythia ovata]|uniref:Uncharacterized protein n=1 Tax=Forsythia ovata TaxID=205694 RepID=A0ABD1XCF9_9LAMI
MDIMCMGLQDARNFGWELNERIDFDWKKLLHKKVSGMADSDQIVLIRICPGSVLEDLNPRIDLPFLRTDWIWVEMNHCFDLQTDPSEVTRENQTRLSRESDA